VGVSDAGPWVTRLMSDVDRLIGEHGWMITGTQALGPGTVGGGGAAYAYTTGLTEQDLPELCVSGLGYQLMKNVLNTAARNVAAAGTALVDGAQLADLVSVPLTVIDGLPRLGGIWPTVAFNRYGPDRVRLQQLVWPDSGHLPWEAGYDLPADAQPLLRRRQALWS
jgi:Domain of unknown function (DUF4262)